MRYFGITVNNKRTKIKLVSRFNDFLGPRSPHMWSLFEPYFEWQPWQLDHDYDRENTVFVSNWMNSSDGWLLQKQDQGYRVVIDSSWEPHLPPQQIYEIKHSQWFWFLTSQCLQHLSYDSYVPNKNMAKTVFMPVNYMKPFRVQMINSLAHRLDNFLWSNQCRDANPGADRKNGQGLPGDVSPENNEWIFYVNPLWYDQTFCSLVLESTDHAPPFLTEKTFKAMAFHHPFMLLGAPGCLTTLRNWGFETFENLFDESYDQTENLGRRIDIIVKNVDRITIMDYDIITKQKLQHNHQRFYDSVLVQNKVINEIIHPLLQYVNS